MNNELNYLFQYLDKEDINIDKEEFLFQNQSHPDYPSLLALSDTLSFFNIENICAKIDYNQIALLPNQFIALLNNDLGIQEFYYIENVNQNFFLFQNKKRISISNEELYRRWEQIVLVIEKSDSQDIINVRKTKNSWVLIVISIFFLSVLYSYKEFSLSFLFFIFPLIGILFSVAALKDLFGAKSKLINNFCTITTSTSCDNVINSNKWKIFKILNFSDLSIVFFSSQLIGLFLALLQNSAFDFFVLQKVMLLISLPVVFTSIYYQKNVEKKWCPICLAIILIIVAEIIVLFFVTNYNFNFSFKEFLLFGFLFASTFVIWNQIKQLLMKQKQLKEKLFKSIRFERNYENFKNNLLIKPKLILPKTPLIFGNSDSKVVITLISNPFCGYCKGAHKIIQSILENHKDNIEVRIILKTNLSTDNDDVKKIIRSLNGIYKEKGEDEFLLSLKNWFDNKNLAEWVDKFSSVETFDFDEVLNPQYEWCQENNYNFTPAIFINGYEYPQTYDRGLLLFFANDLVEDEF